MRHVSSCEASEALLLQNNQCWLQFTKGDRVFALSPDWSQTSKWGMQPAGFLNCKMRLTQRQARSHVCRLHAGTYAELASIKSSLLATIPDDVSFDQAGALPLVCLTALQVRQLLMLSSSLHQGCQQTCFHSCPCDCTA